MPGLEKRSAASLTFDTRPLSSRHHGPPATMDALPILYARTKDGVKIA